MDLQNLKVATDSEVSLLKIPNESYNLVLDAGSTLSKKALRHIINKNQNRTEVFVFLDKGNLIGSLCVMYKNGNDPEYRIRKIDAYIYGVYVNKEYRGNGYASVMLKKLGAYLLSRGICKAHLAVSVNNESGIRAYEKTGFKIVAKKSFFRILKINIPYHKL